MGWHSSTSARALADGEAEAGGDLREGVMSTQVHQADRGPPVRRELCSGGHPRG